MKIMKIMKIKPFYLVIILFFVAIAIHVYFYPKIYRKAYIYGMFYVYDIYTLGGNTWKLDPEYCSYMKEGFHTNIPLSFYKDFNIAIQERIPSGNNELNIENVKQCCDNMLQYIRENNIPESKARSLPIVSIHEENHKEMIQYYVDKNLPFVLRDVKLDVFENMKFKKIVEKFKDDKVLFSPSFPHCKEQKVDVFSNITKNKCYISNVTNVFDKYPDLIPETDVSTLETISGGHMDSKQMFVGVTRGSGTGLHNAFTNNFYLNIEGQKTWTFFNPNNTPLLYPYFSKTGVYNAGESRFYKYGKTDLTKFPLMKYCDYYEYTIQPGEILYNPASWWHAIYNETELTVAMSTRWVFPDYYSKMLDYHLLRSGNLRNPELRDLAEKLYTEYGILGISQIDEHNILGNSENSKEIPVWDTITNENHKLCLDKPCHLKWHSV